MSQCLSTLESVNYHRLSSRLDERTLPVIVPDNCSFLIIADFVWRFLKRQTLTFLFVGWLVDLDLTAIEIVFQSISNRLPEEGRKERNDR